jgi:hypothetical protein
LTCYLMVPLPPLLPPSPSCLLQQNKGTWPHVLFRENAAIHPKNLDQKVCENIPGMPHGSSSLRVEVGKKVGRSGSAIGRVSRGG